jgi:ABC-type transporter Mla subunit MlaD
MMPPSGAARVAVRTEKSIKIIATSKIKAATEKELGDSNIRLIPEAEQEEERPGRRRKLRSAADVNREQNTADREIRRLQESVTEERAARLLKAKLKVKRLNEFM